MIFLVLKRKNTYIFCNDFLFRYGTVFICYLVSYLPYWLICKYVWGSFHAKTTTFQKSCQVTPSDFAHIQTICSSIGRMNTQKKSAANSLRFRKYSSSKIWPDPPFLASACRVIDLSDLWPAFIPVCNKIQKSKLLLGVIFTHIFKIWSQKYDILFSFYTRGTSTWALVTYNNYFFHVQGHVVSEQKATGGSYYIYVISRHICQSKSR